MITLERNHIEELGALIDNMPTKYGLSILQVLERARAESISKQNTKEEKENKPTPLVAKSKAKKKNNP